MFCKLPLDVIFYPSQPPYHALSAQFTAYRSTVWTIYKALPPHAHAAVQNCVAEGEIKGPSKQGSINMLCPVVNGNVISRNLTTLLSDGPISLTLSLNHSHVK